ncbi:sodium:proton antiporter [uncultured Adlercreutzia sp.]|uniref:cation:proton antiporter n=1 Tax=uncultured Adlercreutzia sp. TaxID=875803 RepID=UPI0025FDC95D|nr:sodium:proton antiporter [uncultured Adlercreutzia sp.]
MQALEFSLIILACVIGSAVLCQVVRRLSLPLVQIAVGCVAALLVPAVSDVHMPSELFLVLFIAPLLFNEARNTAPRELWENKGSILSLAVGLVLLTVLVVGFVLNWFVPSIPLAAAFACAAALAPTDAAAVGALGSSVSLKKRQSTLLSGESLINDASGVVAFQFASAAAVTGAFSLVEAGESFLILFFGGIGVGAALGAAGKYFVRALRRLGYESTTVHVLYEVFSPFFVFLFAEWLQVSGILAVVAAGLVMAEREQRLTSSAAAQRQLVSNGFWRIIVFLINSVVFILLGVQLPQAFAPAIADQFSFPFLLGVVALTTALIVACRFAWVLVMEIVHRVGLRRQRGHKGHKHASSLKVCEPNTPSPTPHLVQKRPHWKERVGSLLRNALVLTIGGPKGAVTLSIIFTLPMEVADGSAFPNRDLIIFLTAAVILCTLLLADFLLPLLAPRESDPTSEKEVRAATIKVLEGTLAELQSMLARDDNPQYDPALRLTIAHYRVRLMHEREAADNTCSHAFEALNAEVRRVQEEKAAQIHQEGGYDVSDLTPYYAMLRRVRQSVGYAGTDVKVGSRFRTVRGRLALLWQRTKPGEVTDDAEERIYYDTCLFAISLEHAAIDYLQGVVAENDERCHAAQILLEEHRTALNSLWNRINYGQDVKQEDRTDLTLDHHFSLPEGMRPLFGKQFAEAARYADAVDADALTTELDQIRHLQEHGEISLPVANELRQRVYVLQMSLGD